MPQGGSVTKPEDTGASAHFELRSVHHALPRVSPFKIPLRWYLLLTAAARFAKIVKPMQGVQSTEHNLRFVRAYYLVLRAMPGLTFQTALHKRTIKINQSK